MRAARKVAKMVASTVIRMVGTMAEQLGIEKVVLKVDKKVALKAA